MKLIVLAHPEEQTAESKYINALFDAGMELFHLRKPGYSLNDYEALLQQIRPEFYDRIVLHQYHHLAEAYGIQRIHFSESDRPNTLRRREGVIYSTSIHDPQKPIEWNKYEYVFVGPLFDSLSKEGYTGKGLAFFEALALEQRSRCVAIGGIQQQKIAELKNAGFAGMAVIGAVWNSSDPLRAFREIKEQCALTYSA